MDLDSERHNTNLAWTNPADYVTEESLNDDDNSSTSLKNSWKGEEYNSTVALPNYPQEYPDGAMVAAAAVMPVAPLLVAPIVKQEQQQKRTTTKRSSKAKHPCSNNNQSQKKGIFGPEIVNLWLDGVVWCNNPQA